jgi:glycerate 2-kinase
MSVEHLRQIARAAIASVDPDRIVRETLREGVDLPPRVIVIGFGKAAYPMARAAEAVLGDRIEGGLIVTKPGRHPPLEKIRVLHGGHPVPDAASVRAAEEIAALADSVDEKTLVLVLVSGGGSSLVAAPAAGSGVTLQDIQETTRPLLACGATIQEMNCIRKHLLLLAGGKLAARCAPAASVSLVLSDVVGDDLSVIASGPTRPDPTTFSDALAVIDSYGIGGTLPPAVTAWLADGAAGRHPETPKPGDPALAGATAHLVGTNRRALEAAHGEAVRLGYDTVVLTSRLTGEAREAARFLAAVARDAGRGGLAVKRPACILAGGETTVTVRGAGRGGRNTEMAAAFLLEAVEGTHFLSFSTDGEDGPTDAAGGFASVALREAARARDLRIPDALRDNDSYTVLKKLDALFVTGSTGTNVCDIQVMLLG